MLCKVRKGDFPTDHHANLDDLGHQSVDLSATVPLRLPFHAFRRVECEWGNTLGVGWRCFDDVFLKKEDSHKNK